MHSRFKDNELASLHQRGAAAHSVEISMQQAMQQVGIRRFDKFRNVGWITHPRYGSMPVADGPMFRAKRAEEAGALEDAPAVLLHKAHLWGRDKLHHQSDAGSDDVDEGDYFARKQGRRGSNYSIYQHDHSGDRFIEQWEEPTYTQSAGGQQEEESSFRWQARLNGVDLTPQREETEFEKKLRMQRWKDGKE